MFVYHRIVYIPFIMTLIFESQCVELIHWSIISLVDVSLPGIVDRALCQFKICPPRLNTILDLLMYIHFELCFLDFEFILCLLC